ncbi:MAG: sugar ABC transporter permease [Deinococcota bacterium]
MSLRPTTRTFAKIQWSGYLYVLPALAVLAAFILWPTIYSLLLSVQRWDFLSEARPFVGLQNYQSLLESSEFRNSLRVTLIFVGASVPARIVLALALAHLVLKETRLNRVLRGVYFLPVVSSSVAISLSWRWLFNTDAGLVNAVIQALGGPAVPWLINPTSALWAVVIVAVWQQLGYDIVLFIAGLKAIPQEYIDAARIDGAHGGQVFRFITIPLLSPTTFFVLIISVIGSFQVFSIVNVMTGGGPALGTDVLVNLLYRRAFIFFDIGRASALAVLLLLILLGLTYIQFRFLGRRVHYG